jgi:hypothetical protein
MTILNVGRLNLGNKIANGMNGNVGFKEIIFHISVKIKKASNVLQIFTEKFASRLIKNVGDKTFSYLTQNVKKMLNALRNSIIYPIVKMKILNVGIKYGILPIVNTEI